MKMTWAQPCRFASLSAASINRRARPRPRTDGSTHMDAQLAGSAAPGKAGDAGEDPTVVVADKDAQFLLSAEPGRIMRGSCHLLLEERQVGRRWRIVHHHAVLRPHKLLPLGEEHLFHQGGVVEVVPEDRDLVSTEASATMAAPSTIVFPLGSMTRV